jgi:hypothetical protein
LLCSGQRWPVFVWGVLVGGNRSLLKSRFRVTGAPKGLGPCGRNGNRKPCPLRGRLAIQAASKKRSSNPFTALLLSLVSLAPIGAGTFTQGTFEPRVVSGFGLSPMANSYPKLVRWLDNFSQFVCRVNATAFTGASIPGPEPEFLIAKKPVKQCDMLPSNILLGLRQNYSGTVNNTMFLGFVNPYRSIQMGIFITGSCRCAPHQF